MEMADTQKVVIWTPQQRQDVLGFLKQYTDKLASEIEDPASNYGLNGIQSGASHIMDMIFPTGLKYEVNRGPDRNPLDDTRVIFDSEEHEQYECERQGE
jgi:hypothetical protein